MKRENAVLLHFFKKIATTWINLQDAYTVEATSVGTWSQIGYNAPGTQAAGGSSSYTNNFGYSDGTVSNDQITWTATAKVKLNDCQPNSTWTATAKSAHHSSEGTTYVQITTGGEPLCTGLTPSFANLARSSQ